MTLSLANQAKNYGFVMRLIMSMTISHGIFDFLKIQRDVMLVYVYMLSIIVGILFMDLFVTPMIIFFIGASCYHFGRDFEFLTLDPRFMIFGVMLVTGTVLSPSGKETIFNINEDDKPGLWIWRETLDSLGMDNFSIFKITEICNVIWLFSVIFLIMTRDPKLTLCTVLFVMLSSSMTVGFISVCYMTLIHIPIAVRSVEMAHGSLPVIVWFFVSLLGTATDVESFFSNTGNLRVGVPVICTHIVTNWMWENRYI